MSEKMLTEADVRVIVEWWGRQVLALEVERDEARVERDAARADADRLAESMTKATHPILPAGVFCPMCRALAAHDAEVEGR